MEFSKEEITYLIHALANHKEKLERMDTYPLQKKDMQPYTRLIRRFVKYRQEHWVPKTAKKPHFRKH